MVQTMKNVKIILFAVMAPNKYVLITIFVGLKNLTFGEDAIRKFIDCIMNESVHNSKC